MRIMLENGSIFYGKKHPIKNTSILQHNPHVTENFHTINFIPFDNNGTDIVGRKPQLVIFQGFDFSCNPVPLLEINGINLGTPYIIGDKEQKCSRYDESNRSQRLLFWSNINFYIKKSRDRDAGS